MPATTQGSDAARPRAPSAPATGGPARAARAPMAVPHRWQKLEPATSPVPQAAQAAASSEPPHDAQNRPDAAAPQDGQCRADVVSVMRES